VRTNFLGMKMIPEQKVSPFLYFGYFPTIMADLKDEPWATVKTVKARQKYIDEAELLSQGISSLQSAYKGVSSRDMHIVPLSGGLDSRAVLGGLLSEGLRNHIITVTFGIPGTLDYDIANVIAKRAGVRHESINLTQVKLDQDALEETAKSVRGWIWLFDAFYLRLVNKRFGKKVVYWSGFMGDPLAGSHLPQKESSTWNSALSEFVIKNRFTSSINIANPNYCPEDSLPKVPILENSALSFDDQLDFSIRQQTYIRDLVIPQGYSYQTPFLSKRWVEFILGIPRQYREHQYIYKEILKSAYPELFSFPITNNLGLPLSAPWWSKSIRFGTRLIKDMVRKISPWQNINWIYPNTKYIDFNLALRDRQDIKTLVYENIQDLKSRKIVDWVDIDSIWQYHQTRNGNYADVLTLLASLEIYLKLED